MRRSLPLVLLSLSLILAACGGGDDDDDQTPTATSGAITATSASGTTATAAATGAAGATETGGPGSGSGAGSGPGSGAGGTSVPVDATPTGGVAAATATRRPATVVATPRPIATQRPQPTTPPQPDATATGEPPTEVPPTAEEGQLVIIMEDDFDAGTTDWFELGTTEFNTTLEIVDGQFVITPDVESWQTLTIGPDETWSFADGLITADVSLDPGSEFGLVARQFQDDAGIFYFYLCWLTSAGVAGCNTYVDGEFSLPLFTLDDPALFQEVNTLLLQIIGTELIYEVNGTQIGVIEDTTIEAGYWGFYAWGDASRSASRVDYVAIAVP